MIQLYNFPIPLGPSKPFHIPLFELFQIHSLYFLLLLHAHLLSLYVVNCMYVFLSALLVLESQCMCSLLGKTVSLSLSIR